MKAPVKSARPISVSNEAVSARSLDGNYEPAVATPKCNADAATDWVQQRRPVALSDRTLLDRTFKWLATLPPAVRPLATGARYPRIVNRIGDLWGHCEYTRLYLQSLLIDRRPGRKGFPPEVQRELEALQQYYFEHLAALPAVLWNAVPVRPARIPNEIFPYYVDPAEIEIEEP